MNQKRRTRAAIVAAAEELFAQGITPTVAQAAEAAEVSRTTAYRYFPTQESLIVELTVTLDVDDVEGLVHRPLEEDESATDRLLVVLDSFNRHVAGEETQYRTALRVYLDQWLAAVAAGESAPMVREGRRGRWFRASLEPVRGTVPDADLDRLVAALSMLCGTEALVVLRDVAHLDEEQGRTVVDWAARTLIAATFDDPTR